MHWSAITLGVLAAALLLCPSPPSDARGSERRSRFETVGLYVWKDSPDQHAFWKACGINTLQFCDTHWSIRAEPEAVGEVDRSSDGVLNDYYRRFADGIANATRSGFRTDVILFSNIAQWTGPEEREPTGTGVLFDPRDRQALEARLQAIARAVRALKKADGFTFFGGDPGGAVRAPFGPLPAAEWIHMAREVRKIVKRKAPRAHFSVNPWAIAHWQYPMLSCFTAEWWIREDQLTQQILEAPDLIGPDCGVQIAAHAYYRPLALRMLSQEKSDPSDASDPSDSSDKPDRPNPPFPDALHIRALLDRGTQHVWAWPYFLLDEADDGDFGPEGRVTQSVQIATRYIHRHLARMRQLGFNGIIGNWSYAGYLPAAVNTYAFGRFARDARATPERVLDEYARCLADEASWRDLAQVLRFVENSSTWERKLPPENRLPHLTCDLKSVEEARHALNRVVPRAKPLFALPEPARGFLSRLARRLESRA